MLHASEMFFEYFRDLDVHDAMQHGVPQKNCVKVFI